MANTIIHTGGQPAIGFVLHVEKIKSDDDDNISVLMNSGLLLSNFIYITIHVVALYT